MRATHFDPRKAVSPSDKATVEQRILTERARLERALSEGDAQLAAFSKEILPGLKSPRARSAERRRGVARGGSGFASDGPIGRLVLSPRGRRHQCARRRDAMATAAARAARGSGWESSGRCQLGSSSTRTYGNPRSSRTRWRSISSVALSAPNCGTTISSSACRVRANSTVPRSTSRVTVISRSIAASLR
jgi:hypothetical protein